MDPGPVATITMTAITVGGLAAVIWQLAGAIVEAIL